MPSRAAIAGTVVCATAFALRDELALLATVAKYVFQVYIVDLLPMATRRSILSQEYEGDMLEKRLTQRIFKGFSTVKALWRMSSVNMRPRLRVNDRVPEGVPLTDLKGNALQLRDLMQGDRPLVLNFGSCS